MSIRNQRHERTMPSTDVSGAAGGPDALPGVGDGWHSTTAAVAWIGHRRLLVLPLAAPVGPSRGRRFLVEIGDRGTPHQAVVLSVAGRAAVAAPDDLPLSADETPVRLKALPPRRRPRIPADLAARLAADGLDAAAIPEAELAQLIHMINESAAPGVRAARLAAAQQVVAHWSRHAGRG